MKTNDPEKAAVLDISDIVKRINEIKDAPMAAARSLCLVVEELSKKYYIILIPQKELNKIRDASIYQVLKYVLSNNKVIIKDYIKYIYHGELFMLDFAHHVSKEFKCPVDIITCDTYFCTRVRYTIAVF